MRNQLTRMIFTMAAVLAISPLVHAQSQADANTATKPNGAKHESFDPHNLNGSWIGARGFGDDNMVPEPPLSQWGKEHLLTKSISHNALGTGAPQATTGPTAKTADYNGVPVNIPIGGYPGQRCDPIGPPSPIQLYRAYPIQFIMLPDRMYQMFENHREWRVIWLNRDHPKNVFPTYMGDSVAKWDGDTLVVDTIGFNGKDWISENLGQLMSDAFHLVERYHLKDATHMDLDMIYYDPKAWGDKPWTGLEEGVQAGFKGDSLGRADVRSRALERHTTGRFQITSRIRRRSNSQTSPHCGEDQTCFFERREQGGRIDSPPVRKL